MDGSAGQRDPVGSRAPSRTSTTSSHAHRHHHAHCGPSNPTTPQLSSFLQERIQQRRAEKKSSEGNLSTSTGNTRDDNMAQSSPVRRSATAALRPARSAVTEDETNVMGIKEIDKTIETLKKQNWDLKLELYHRRERQTGLEEQAKALQEEVKTLQEENENLQDEQSETMKLNDDLARELEKRDKALMEAVDFIMELQSTVAALEQEKAMVRSVEAAMDGSLPRSHNDGPFQMEVHTSDLTRSPNRYLAGDLPGSVGESKTLERMSSFLSERGDRAANLRDMILHNKSSFIHVRKVSGVSVDPSEINRMASPSLSILSESSFMSVYGSNENPLDESHSPPEVEEPATRSRTARPTLGQRTSYDSVHTQRSASLSGRTPKEAIRGGASLGAHVQPLDRIIGMSSPLQRIERLEGRQPANGSSHLSPASQRQQSHVSGIERTQSLVKSKPNKRETLRRVITSSPDANDLAHARTLPPTPDTTSSSMLRRHQNSDDTLSGEPRLSGRNDVAQEAQTLPLAALPPQLTPRLAKEHFSPLAPIPVVSQQRKQSRPSLNTDAFKSFSDLPRTVAQRPRSIDESTLSRHRANSWASQTDSDGGADARSEVSEVDYWLRESAKPNKQTDRGDHSPDLFSFPHGAGRWETDVIFGAMHGAGFLGSPAANLKRDPMDERGGALIAPMNGIYEPPEPESRDGGIGPPVRRSSRSARTGSMTSSIMSPEAAGSRKGSFRKGSATQHRGRPRRNSIDSAQVRPSNATTHVDYQTDGAGAAKRSQYPPPAGQPTRQRKSGALHRLFRRSIGGSQDLASLPANVAGPRSPEVQKQHLSPHRGETPNGRSSVPPPAVMPWRAPPAVYSDDRSGATPPPIMRNRTARTESGMRKGSVQEPLTPRSTNTTMVVKDERETAEIEGALVSPQGGRRKWLGLGRRSSLKGRNA